VSKERARRRAEREALAAEQRAAALAEAERDAARRQRRSRLARLWRSNRLWRQGKSSAKVRERRAIVASTLLVVLVTTYLATRSIGITVGVSLVAAIATPALAAAFLDRS
jgi:Flp pilus assembly protein TadB